MGYLLIVVLLVAPSLALSATANNLNITQTAQQISQNNGTRNSGIPLNEQQISSIEQNKTLIATIKGNYWRNRTYYSKLQPIVQLTEDQNALVLSKYGHFFTEKPPSKLDVYVYDGIEITPSTGSQEAPAVAAPSMASSLSSTTGSTSRIAVCPSTGVYEEIMFVVNDEDELLQMIQLESFGQWILDESCLSTTGNAVGTICVERERLVPASVINLETSEITYEQIKVVSCAAYTE